MTKTGWVVLLLLCCLCTLVRSDVTDTRQNTNVSDIPHALKEHQEKLQSETSKELQAVESHSETPKDHQTTESQSIMLQSPTSQKVPHIQTPTDLSKHASIKLMSHTMTPSSLLASLSARPSLNPLDDEDEYDADDEFIRTESIQEARLARKKQRATAVMTLHESNLPNPVEKQTFPKSDPPMMQGPEDMPADPSSSSSSSSSPSSSSLPETPTGLGTIGTTLLSVGGVLMVAGITGGIFVWRAVQQRPSSSPPLAGKTELPINLLDLESSPKDPPPPPPPPPPSEVVTHRSSGLDFNYSMEKLFNNTSRPVGQSTAPPVISNPAHVASSIAEEKVQIEDEDLYAASPISIYFPSTTP